MVVIESLKIQENCVGYPTSHPVELSFSGGSFWPADAKSTPSQVEVVQMLMKS